MIPRRRAAATAALFGAVLGCGANSEQTAVVSAVSPPMAHNDATSSLVIHGSHFRPAYRFDTMAGAASTEVGAFLVVLTPTAGGSPAGASIPLGGVTWQSPDALSAVLPAGAPAGVYDLAVTDPRGQRVRRDGAFVSLGPDEQAPVVSIEAPEPTSIIGAETTVSVTLLANDGDGMLVSLTAVVTLAGTPRDVVCPVAPAMPQTPCHFDFAAPTPASESDTVDITATATDSVGLTGTASASFRLAPRPTLASVTPTVGRAAGSTLLEVRGTDFVQWLMAGSVVLSKGTELLIDGEVIPASVLDATLIRAATQPHDWGMAQVTVSTGGAETESRPFEFVAPPVVRVVSPTQGPLAGGTRIAIGGNHFRDGTTTFQLGNNPLRCPKFVSPNRVEGVVPAATASGPTTVVASDLIGGTGTLPGAFNYDPLEAEPPDGGIDPTNCDGVP